jgi:hypothetical protein
MKCDDLTPAQAQKLKDALRPMLSYLNRLKKHMEKRHELNVHVHYLSCESGVGRQIPREAQPLVAHPGTNIFWTLPKPPVRASHVG